MDQMMGDLLYRRVSPSELKEMPYHEMKYWHGWHLIIAKKEGDKPNA